ncbi:hypothetical protein GYMLUDRAFT_431131 [Collybiopsis luxurians FD-317 M1]|uniref:Uncharacterized protein n=1 Tax=Collybiopsis luxurians FD-317 M1 TaxID=944289 RepID=A0A0D0C7E7_9AGAR|nr:hypothetical protein GYMLUDRAFT_431131 [Collybiopsis luxurians FD-317 M1]
MRMQVVCVISFSQMPPPPPQKESLKRSRDPGAVQPDPMQTDTTRQFAGSRRVSNSLNPTLFSGGPSTATAIGGGSTFHQQSAPGVFSATNAPASGFNTFYGVNVGGQDQLHSLDSPPQSILHSEPSAFGFGSFSGGGADVSSFGGLGIEDPRMTASAWNNPK